MRSVAEDESNSFCAVFGADGGKSRLLILLSLAHVDARLDDLDNLELLELLDILDGNLEFLLPF